MHIDARVIVLIILVVFGTFMRAIATADHRSLLLCLEELGTRIFALFCLEWVIGLEVEIIQNIRDVMIEELAERHHGDAFQIPTETPAHQVDVQPLVVITGYQLLR